MVPMIGVEPIRILLHRILSPARLPIPPHRHNVDVAVKVIYNANYNITQWKKSQPFFVILLQKD